MHQFQTLQQLPPMPVSAADSHVTAPIMPTPELSLSLGNTSVMDTSTDVTVMKESFVSILQARIQGFFLGARNPPPPPPTAVCNIFFIFKPTDVNFPLPFKFHCRIQST